MKLTSIDYAQLIQYAAYSMYKTVLNRTQINKILFCVYGAYLAKKGELLFEDDYPKAWPYGPVFPIVNKRIIAENVPRGFPRDKTMAFRRNTDALNIVKDVVQKLHGMSAYKLTEWSHREGSPWYMTVFPEGGGRNVWNTEIKRDLIERYFKEETFS